MDSTIEKAVVDATTALNKNWAVVVGPDGGDAGVEVVRAHLNRTAQKLTIHERGFVRSENVPYFLTLLLIQERVVGEVLGGKTMPIFQLDPSGGLRLVDRNLNPV